MTRLKHLSCMLLFFLFPLILGSCAAQKQAIIKSKYIDLSREVRIAIMPWVDKTGLIKLAKWPKNQEKSDKLISFLHETAKAIKNQIGRHSRLNRIKIVHQSQFPDYRIQIVFNQALEAADGWDIPLDLRVYDQSSSSGDFSHTFTHTGKVKEPYSSEKSFYYWDVLLQNYQATFPYKEITEKLFSNESKKE